jgi:hypothetical protein
MCKAVEEKIRFEEYSGYFWCGVPQEVCNRWEDNGRGRIREPREEIVLIARFPGGGLD